MKGTLYGVGVGPGDPELITLKAVKVIEQADVIAAPQSGEGEPLAYSIARQAVPSIQGKPLLELSMPMIRDLNKLEEKHGQSAAKIVKLLDEGKNVALLTLGDPSIYSTYIYIHQKTLELGGKTRMVPGVPSFCAVAAVLNTSLVEGAQPLHIIPASHERVNAGLGYPGTKVLMKTGKSFPAVKQELEKRGLLKSAQMVQRCGMLDETIYDDLQDAGQEAGYFSIILVKDGEL